MTNTQTTLAGNKVIPGRSNQLSIGIRKPLLAFIFFALAMTAVGAVVFQHYRDNIKKEREDELGGIAELKIGQITNWLAERRGDAQTLKDDPLFVSAVGSWLQRGGTIGETRTNLLTRLSFTQQAYAAYGYTSISLFDEQAMLRLSSSSDEAPIQGIEKERLRESMRSGQIIFSDIHREQLNGSARVEIELRVPLTLVKNGKAHSIGAVLFRIDPERFLFPLIQHWPTSSASAENILVRRDGDEVVFLNELRHSKNTALAMHLPLSQSQLPAAMAAMGQEGLVEGMDYRGVPVVGVLNKIPGTSWAIVSKIDKAEIYAPISHLINWIVLLMLGLVSAGGAIVIYWRQKEKTQYEHELERQALVLHLDYLTKYANDIIILMDDAGKIIDFNDRALEAYGYSAEDFITLHRSDLRAIDLTRTFTERLEEINRAGSLRYESTHLRRNGESFPVEVTVRVVDVAGKKFHQAIVRDLTERKLAEAHLENERTRLHTLIQTIPDLVWLKDAEGVYLSCNPQMERLYGTQEANIIGKTDYDFVEVKLADWFRMKDLEAMAANKQSINEEWVTFPDNGQRVLLETIKTPMRDAEDKLIGVMGIARDITERKQAETRESRLRRILDKTRDMIFMFHPDTLRFVYVNKGAIDSIGYSSEELLLLTPADITPPLPEPELRKLIVPLVSGEKELLRFETAHKCKNGADLPVEVQLQLVQEQEGESVFVAIVRDISERMRAEIELRRQKSFMWQVIDSDPSQIFVKDIRGKYLLVNQSTAIAHGLTPQEMVGRSHAEINRASGEVGDYLADDRKVIEEGDEVSKVALYTLPSGERRWFLVIKKRLTMPDGKFSVLGIALDINQQKLFELQLAESYKELQRLTLHLENIRAEERAKIALNLHDEMGATLAALKMKVSWLASKLPAELPLLSAEAVQINELIADGIHTMHHIVDQLRPDMLGDVEFTEAIKVYVQKFLAHTDIECILVLPKEEFVLNAEQSLTIFRILQEALNNVVKHAQASRVDIHLTARGKTLVMEIRDNGIGFDPTMHKQHSLGLLGIRERALMVGGRAKVSSMRGKGACVSVSIPPPPPLKIFGRA